MLKIRRFAFIFTGRLLVAILLAAIYAHTALAECALGYTQVTVPLCQLSSSTALPMDVLTAAGTPAVAAYSMNRALSSGYSGPLFRAIRASDNATQDIGQISGVVNHSTFDTFCSGTTCFVQIIYNQQGNSILDLYAGTGYGPTGSAALAIKTTLANGTTIFEARKEDSGTQDSVALRGGVGYYAGTRRGLANNGGMPGCNNPTQSVNGGCAASVTQYWLFNGFQGNNSAFCCYDFGEGESVVNDDGNGHMFANKQWAPIGQTCPNGFYCLGGGQQIDIENGSVPMTGTHGGGGDVNYQETLVSVGIAKTDSTTYTGKGGDAQSGTLTTWWNHAPFPNGYFPLHLEGGLAMMQGGDGSLGSTGGFYEGMIAAAQTADATDDAIQSNIVSFYGPP